MWLCSSSTFIIEDRDLSAHLNILTIRGFFWEAKAPGKRPSAAQLEWMSRRRQVGLEATWFNQFAAADRPAEACEPRDSHVFEVWFLRYFNGESR
jgi:hypothetical protein